MNLFSRKQQVLMVCTENLCRSPVAEGFLRLHLERAGAGGRVRVDSAGTRTSRPGSRADQRAQKVAAAAGVNLRGNRARRVTAADFERSELLLAMDRRNVEDLLQQCPDAHRHKVRLILDILPDSELAEVPDPYYGSLEGFRRVQDILDTATRAWAQYLLRPPGEP